VVDDERRRLGGGVVDELQALYESDALYACVVVQETEALAD
jgi:hypothetical protein